MRRLGLLLAIALALTPAAALASAPAHPALAYIDPGAGSFLLQALLATLAGIAVAVSAYWRRIKRFLGMAVPEDEDAASRPQPPDEP